MLTPDEEKWLEERQKRSIPCGLNESWNWRLNICICGAQTFPLRPPCPMAPDYHDAAEFEARVAAELATARMEINWHGYSSCCPVEMTKRGCSNVTPQDCHWCHLKYARLMVEQEMEAEHDR